MKRRVSVSDVGQDALPLGWGQVLEPSYGRVVVMIAGVGGGEGGVAVRQMVGRIQIASEAELKNAHRRQAEGVAQLHVGGRHVPEILRDHRAVTQLPLDRGKEVRSR